jgi:hypothetical protein
MGKVQRRIGAEVRFHTGRSGMWAKPGPGALEWEDPGGVGVVACRAPGSPAEALAPGQAMGTKWKWKRRWGPLGSLWLGSMDKDSKFSGLGSGREQRTGPCVETSKGAGVLGSAVQGRVQEVWLWKWSSQRPWVRWSDADHGGRGDQDGVLGLCESRGLRWSRCKRRNEAVSWGASRKREGLLCHCWS